ncbi:T9SS type A sorting domain-containing protein [Ulvibacter antarcticus]|uniref:Putative secreted protein (Por secretion system target) n=1 Tax=Ulvibacter antarcticus TaxID=442714 RepID=A0A3L9Z2J6_9FLAO|nr:T9SS type A sorting domain-containing protein [Ulvibacter antarcticus]RMA64525.1 putative secreted protein (Por secretion system target) [Ulvibacter antarcticus]
MKKLFLIIAFTFYGYCYAQNYIPVFEADHVWNVDLFKSDGTVKTNQFELQPGFQSGGIMFWEVNGINGPCYFGEDAGLIYQSVNGVVDVLYDFTLEIGDIHTYPAESCLYTPDNPYNGETFMVTDLEHQQIGGRQRKMMQLKDDINNPTYIEYWVEGIGTLRGLVAYNDLTTTEYTLLACFTEDNVTRFFNGATSCDNTTLGITTLSSEEILFYPNPVTSVSVLQLPFEAAADFLKIYDQNGRLISSETITKDHVFISADEFQSGMYFYQVSSKGNTVKTEQFIVK